jgi:hypothetical protein
MMQNEIFYGLSPLRDNSLIKKNALSSPIVLSALENNFLILN